MTVVGADGCKAGWFFFDLKGRRSHWGVVPSVLDLLDACPDADLVLIDIPIGLLEAPPGVRACDAEARKVLKPYRHTSVFPAPSRPAVYASGYGAANAINKETIGKGLTAQSWGIVPKIRELDLVMRASERARAVIREAHPEVCFWALAGDRAMRHAKKTAAGQRERLAVLDTHWPGGASAVREVLASIDPTRVAPDDVVDAAALAISASRRRLVTLPAAPGRDRFRLPMEMVFGRRGD